MYRDKILLQDYEPSLILTLTANEKFITKLRKCGKRARRVAKRITSFRNYTETREKMVFTRTSEKIRKSLEMCFSNGRHLRRDSVTYLLLDVSLFRRKERKRRMEKDSPCRYPCRSLYETELRSNSSGIVCPPRRRDASQFRIPGNLTGPALLSGLYRETIA